MVYSIMVTVFAQPVHIMQVSLQEAQPSDQLFPAQCQKLSPTPCCFTWFHNTVLSVPEAYPTSHSWSSCPGEESALYNGREDHHSPCLISVPAIPVGWSPPVCLLEEKRQVIHYCFCGVRIHRRQPARANMQEEVGQLSSAVRVTVASLCSWGKGMSSSSH